MPNITGIIEKITKKQTATGVTRTGLLISGEWFGGFETYEVAEGDFAKIEYEVKGAFKNISKVEKLEQPKNALSANGATLYRLDIIGDEPITQAKPSGWLNKQQEDQLICARRSLELAVQYYVEREITLVDKQTEAQKIIGMAGEFYNWLSSKRETILKETGSQLLSP